MAGAAGAGHVLGGRYRLVHPMGSGGSRQTWQAYDELLGTRVVVKALQAPWRLTGAERESWLRGTERQVRRTAGMPRHPNLVPVHDLVVDGHGLWTVMEFTEGRPLAARLAEQGPLSAPEAARVATALLSALQAAHQAMFVHGAVRPDNVMLDGDRVALLIDPETVAHAGHDENDQDDGDDGDEEPAGLGGLVPRVDYLAPERIQGLRQRPASDLYALGVTLYEAVEGVPPFRGHSPAEILMAMLNQPPPPMGRAGWLKPLIEGLLRKDPADRLTLTQAWRLLNPSAPVGQDAPPPALPALGPTAATLDRDYAGARSVPRSMPAPGPMPRAAHPPPITASGGSSAPIVTAVLLLSLVAVCVLLARPVLDHAGSLAEASFWTAVLSWTAFVLGLLLLGYQVRATVRLDGGRHPLRSRLSLVPPPPWSPQELAARRMAAERAVEESLLRVDRRLAAASPRPNRNGGIDA
ncbi:serine/threonine-protein kinase [Streptomyces sp. NRRL F-2747]|uniref:serine/threonine-protein kinase n=1 Tax=Streptomyces sp. NRRL F-2747 TaxID=1463843 RepID=UPI000A7E168B|nr:serine/threonine-protein kinase [Streptomyces sp. NRRL F-2747]